MPRSPFVWEVHVRQEVLEDEVERLRELPYTLWRDVVRTPMTRIVSGRDGRTYRLDVHAAYTAGDDEDIRVTVSLRSPLLRRRLVRSGFVISPSNQFVT
jgi:hypothetical protein